jgi:hypothetical protein
MIKVLPRARRGCARLWEHGRRRRVMCKTCGCQAKKKKTKKKKAKKGKK